MATKIILAGGIQADCDVSNTLSPPLAGCHAGAGLHLAIPPDFDARVLLGQSVPGCNYCKIEDDGSVRVTLDCQIQVVGPSALANLPAALKPQLAPFIVKINAAAVLP